MNDDEKQRLIDLLDNISKRLLSVEQKAIVLERENFKLAIWLHKVETKLHELESDSDV